MGGIRGCGAKERHRGAKRDPSPSSAADKVCESSFKSFLVSGPQCYGDET